MCEPKFFFLRLVIVLEGTGGVVTAVEPSHVCGRTEKAGTLAAVS